MNKININEENNFNAKIDEKNGNIKNLEIDLLDTINDKDLFKNITKNYKNFQIKGINIENNYINNDVDILTDDFQLDINEIIDENSQNNTNNQKDNFINESFYEENDLNEIHRKNNNNENNLDFNSFIKTQNKKKDTKISKSLSSNKIGYKKTSILFKKENNKNKTKINERNINHAEDQKKKLKYSREKIELNKQRINKLYSDYKNILNKRENKKKELSKEEIKDCSFSPKINKKSKKISEKNPKFSKPIFLRYNNDDSRKKFLIKKYELNFTHIPKINKDYNTKINQKKSIYKNNITKINKNRNKTSKNLKINNHIIENANILKKQLLLEEYIRNQKLNNKNNEDIPLYTPKTTATSKSKFSIKKHYNCKNNLNESLNYPIMKNLNLKKYFHNNNSCNKNDKKLIKNKSFYLEYIKGINKKLNQNIFFEQNINPIISINQIDKYYNHDYKKRFININKKNKENVIKRFIDKINPGLNFDDKHNKGICYNITEQCMNIKKIISKYKEKFTNYK